MALWIVWKKHWKYIPEEKYNYKIFGAGVLNIY